MQKKNLKSYFGVTKNSKMETEDQNKPCNNNKISQKSDDQPIEFSMFKESLLTWEKPLQKFIQKKQFQNIYDFICKQYSNKTIYPKFENVFTAFELTTFPELKVVIIGQDPYIKDNQAMGLSFSVPKSQRTIPPSLQNIYKAIQNDIGSKFKIPKHGDLTQWAKQGILLLNSILTVEQNKSDSHKKQGWEDFTDHVVEVINKECEGIVFILWGNPAQKKAAKVDQKKHLILKACHPSPLSAPKGGFFQIKHFSMTNEYLQKMDKKQIDWNLD